jgi:hypothetical protein
VKTVKRRRRENAEAWRLRGRARAILRRRAACVWRHRAGRRGRRTDALAMPLRLPRQESRRPYWATRTWLSSDGVARITPARPDAANAIDSTLARELANAALRCART